MFLREKMEKNLFRGVADTDVFHYYLYPFSK